MLVFLRVENRSSRRKTSWCRVENQQTQPTYDAEASNRTRPTLVEGECSHHFAMPALFFLLTRKNDVHTPTSPLFSIFFISAPSSPFLAHLVNNQD